MARKQNKKRATPQKRSIFRKTVEIGSASQWNAFDLDLLHIDFYYEQYDDLKEMLGDEFYRTDSGTQIDRSMHFFIVSNTKEFKKYLMIVFYMNCKICERCTIRTISKQKS